MGDSGEPVAHQDLFLVPLRVAQSLRTYIENMLDGTGKIRTEKDFSRARDQTKAFVDTNGLF